MRGIFLCGYGCKPWIWEDTRKLFNDKRDEISFIEWPTNLISNFSDISDFSRWVKDNYIKENEFYDFIVGHSMGGLIALHMSTLEKVNIGHTVLVESYITSPGKFFQNILMENSSLMLKEKVINMLKEESKYYSPELSNKLKDLDLTWMLNKINNKLHLIYGDRGINNKAIVLKKLGLNIKTQDHINIEIIPNSCHFPMIENSEELLKIFKSIFFK